MARLGGAPHHLVGSGNLRQTLLALGMLGEPLLQHQTVHLATAATNSSASAWEAPSWSNGSASSYSKAAREAGNARVSGEP